MSVKQCLFSEMSGVVNFEGKPAAGVKLVRMVDYDKKQYDETVTDENGKFYFPAIFRSNFLGKVLPMEFVVLQQIYAYKDGNEYEMWHGVKRKSEENSESRGKPLIVNCELALKEMNYIKVNGSPINSLCTWDVVADVKTKHIFKDKEGNNVDMDGYLVDEYGEHLLDDKGEFIEGAF